jgi:hypothetical protein
MKNGRGFSKGRGSQCYRICEHNTYLRGFKQCSVGLVSIFFPTQLERWGGLWGFEYVMVSHNYLSALFHNLHVNIDYGNNQSLFPKATLAKIYRLYTCVYI